MKTRLFLAALMICAAASAQTDETSDNAYYPLNFDLEQVSKKPSLKVTQLKFKGSTGRETVIHPDQGGTNFIYRPMLTSVLSVEAGETLTATVNYTSDWMNTFIYLDINDNGFFEVADDITQDNPRPECELLTYSYIETVENKSGFDMEGNTLTGDDRNIMAPPAFTIPADMQPGMYRMRVKLDWGHPDPAGRMTATNDIITNGGQIIDLMVNVHTATGALTQEGDNGEILTADGQSLASATVPFGGPLTVKQAPATGYVTGPLTLRYGHRLHGDELLHGNPQWYEMTLPAAATGKDGLITIPTQYLIADLHLVSDFIDENEVVKGDYPLNFNPDELMLNSADRAISSITFTADDGVGIVTGWSVTAPFPVYTDATDRVMRFRAGETITPSCASANYSWMYAYVYIDYNGNGFFDIDDQHHAELVSQSTDPSRGYASMPSFTLPSWMPDGDYRVRFKTDWDCNDPGGRYGEGYTSNLIDANRGQIIDFTLRIDNSLKPASLREETEHCNLYMPDGTTQLPTLVRGLDEITFKVVPMTDYVLDGTLDVVSDAGTVSFDELPEDGIVTAPISGSTLIRAHFKQGPQATWHCIFNDEFNLDDYTWNSRDWNTTTRFGAVWARFNSNHKRDSVAVQNNGYLSLTTKTIGANEMRTGNLMTQNLHDFTYGRVEARCMVYPHNGNFPAFWMMPTTQKPNYNGGGTWGGWPHSGEIDIMEQINWENKAYHTIHTHWANSAAEGGLNQTYQKSGSCYVDMYGKWHIYTLEWDKEQLRWYVDGRHTHTYDRIPEKDNDSDRQWPYDRPFYVIINQSVGNGGWAAAPDFNHQYRMDVDYVRVYQRCEPTAVTEPLAEKGLEVIGGEGRIVVTAPAATRLRVVNIGGATVYEGRVEGTVSIPMRPGIYIVANRKVAVR